MSVERKKVLAVASKGGHWVQLQRLEKVWCDQKVIFLSTDDTLKSQVKSDAFESVIDANMDQKFRLILQALGTLWVLLKYRPHVVISTGAAVGYFAIVMGKIIGAKTVWLDSVANAEELSLAGKKVGKFADVWLTQWSSLEKSNGPKFKGKVF